MNEWINRIARYISVDLTLEYGNEYVDVWSLIHLLSGVILSVIMKNSGYNFLTIFYLQTTAPLFQGYYIYQLT